MFDPDERLNKIGDDVDKEAPLSRLKLFSPCKVNLKDTSFFFTLLNHLSCFYIKNHWLVLYYCSDQCFLEDNWKTRRWVS